MRSAFGFVLLLLLPSLSSAAVVLGLNTTTVSSGQWVQLTWTGVQPSDRSGCWIGLYSPPDANVSRIASMPGPATPPWTATATIKYILCPSVPGFNASGNGLYNFYMIDMRQDAVFWLFTGGIEAPVAVARSPVVTFTDKAAPRYGHLALTGDPSSMRVVWNSAQNDGSATLKWGIWGTGDIFTQAAETYTYTPDDLCGDPAVSQGWRDPGYFHTSVIKGLTPGVTQVWYQYGSNAHGWSPVARFTATKAANPHTPTKVLLVADVGATEPDNALYHWPEPQAGETYQYVSAWGPADLLLHVGDISYATGYSAKWELFCATQTDQLKGETPIMVAQGNHERDVPGTGTFYDVNDSGGECGKPTQARFPVPTQSHDQDEGYYSFNVGSIHFLVMDTELDCGPGSDQYDFFMRDLISVDRNVTPWVVFAGHRPMYYVSIDGSAIDPHFQEFESLLMRFQVDIVLWGHVHNLLVTKPVFNGSVVTPWGPGAYDAPIHVVVGNGGQSLSGLPNKTVEWDRFHANVFGYSIMTAHNETHLEMQFYEDDNNSLIYDFFVYRFFPRL